MLCRPTSSPCRYSPTIRRLGNYKSMVVCRKTIAPWRGRGGRTRCRSRLHRDLSEYWKTAAEGLTCLAEYSAPHDARGAKDTSGHDNVSELIPSPPQNRGAPQG